MKCNIFYHEYDESNKIPDSWLDLCPDDESDDTGIYDVSVPDSWLDLYTDDESDDTEIYDVPVSWDEVPDGWLDLCPDDESDDTGIYDVSVPDSWLDLYTDDESDDTEIYDLPVAVSWDEEVDAVTNSDTGNCMTKMSDKIFHDDDTRKMKGNVEHEHSCHEQNSRAKQLHCEENLPHIQIQINSLQPLEVESENKNAPQDRSSVLFMRNKAKKCRPSAKKRRQAKAKKTDESQIQTVKSTSQPKNCDNDKDSNKSTDVSASDQVPYSLYMTFDDEFSDFTEDEENDEFDDEFSDFTEDEENDEFDDEFSDFTEDENDEFYDEFSDFTEDEENDEFDDEFSDFTEDENDEFYDEFSDFTEDEENDEFNENWSDYTDTFCSQYDGNWSDVVSICSQFEKNWTVSFCSQFDENINWSDTISFCSQFDENWSDTDSCCSEFASSLNLSLICPVKQQEDETFSKHLKDINRAWGIGINKRSSSSSLNNKASNPKKNKKKVHFPSDDKIADVCYMTTWLDAYKEARKGPWQQYAHDHERFQRRIKDLEIILAPVLLPEHRNQILNCAMDN